MTESRRADEQAPANTTTAGCTLKIPTSAIVLAAGYGSRLRPLTDNLPKPMLPLWNKPLIGHTLDMLVRWGVRDVLVNLHHAPAPLFDYLNSGLWPALRISLSFEPNILGTGGAVRRADWFAGNEPLWIVNADVAADLQPHRLVSLYRRCRPAAVLWMEQERGPRTVEMEHGLITNLASLTPGSPGTYTFCGLQLVSPRLRARIADQACISIVEEYRRSLECGDPVMGTVVPGSFWADLGTPESVIAAHRNTLAAQRRREPGAILCPAASSAARRLRRNGVTVRGFAAIAPDAVIQPGAKLQDCVVMSNAHVTSSSSLSHAIVGPDTRVAGQVTRMAVNTSEIADPAFAVVLEKLGWGPHKSLAMPLSPRGSARSFTRLACGRRRAMMLQYSLERPENGLYAGHARTLRKVDLPVPEVLYDDPDRRLTVLRDLGDNALVDHVKCLDKKGRTTLYTKLLKVVATWHTDGTKAARRLTLCQPFSTELYQWEHSLFVDHFLCRRLGLDSADLQPIRRELEAVSGRLLDVKPVLLHRDLQSSNIFMVGRSPYLIDFQGMRMGHPLYDIASLLCDPYVSLSRKLQQTLLRRYADIRGESINKLEVAFRDAAVQRLIQALGAYARLAALPGASAFSRHIRPGTAMLRRFTKRVDNLSHLDSILCYAMSSDGIP